MEPVSVGLVVGAVLGVLLGLVFGGALGMHIARSEKIHMYERFSEGRDGRGG